VNPIPLHLSQSNKSIPVEKQRMTMENPAFEDVSPIKDGDFPVSHVNFSGGNYNSWVRDGCKELLLKHT